MALGALMIGLTGCAAEPAPDLEETDDALQGAPAAPSFTAPSRPKPARHPFVLVHAFHGSATNSWSFNRVKEALEDDGHFVFEAQIQPYNGTPERAGELVKQLDRARAQFCSERKPEQPREACLATTKVNIIGHSQGGLDARYAISKLGYGEQTASLTTMGAPHRGTPVADLALKHWTDRADPIVDALFSLVAKTRTTGDLASDTDLRKAIFWLSEARAGDPAHAMKDADGVYYQSWAGIATKSGRIESTAACEGKVFAPPGRAAKFDLLSSGAFRLLVPAFRRAEHQPNDGHIPVASAKWGVFRGCIAADHLDLIGRPSRDQDDVRWTGFDHVAFYRVTAHELAERGL